MGTTVEDAKTYRVICEAKNLGRVASELGAPSSEVRIVKNAGQVKQIPTGGHVYFWNDCMESMRLFRFCLARKNLSMRKFNAFTGKWELAK